MAKTTTFEFTSTVISIKGQAIVRLPNEVSSKLSTRGQVAVHVSVSEISFDTVLEPDGDRGHWMRLPTQLTEDRTCATTGSGITVGLTPSKLWPEPSLPEDFQLGLELAPTAVQAKWQDITPMARWVWIRWISETRNLDTRKVRIEKTLSKLSGEHRRPCCFNLTACTDPTLSRNGKLLPPDTNLEQRTK